MIRLMAQIDQATKGMDNHDPWDLLQSLCLLLCRAPGR
jgi:DNA polymerase III delta subunit